MAARMTKRADGRYAIKVTTADGTAKFAYGKTQAEAKRKADEMRERLSAGLPVRDATRTLADWLGEWETTYLKVSDRAASSKVMYAGYCRLWIIPTLGNVPLGKLTPNDVNRLLLAMQDAGKATSTIRNCYTTLRKAIDDAVTNGLLAANPAHRIPSSSTSTASRMRGRRSPPSTCATAAQKRSMPTSLINVSATGT